MPDQVNPEPGTMAVLGDNKICREPLTGAENDSEFADIKQYIHLCPVCGKKHFVNETKRQLAYGKHYTCSVECEIKRRKTWWHFA